MKPDTTLTKPSTIQRIKKANELKASKTLENKRHFDNISSNYQTQETILKAFKSLVNYLENRTSKTEVVNQLKEIGTPDAMKVVSAINELHTTLKTHENTDLSEVTSLLKGVLEQAKAIPKSHQKIDIPTEITVKNPVDNSKDFKNLLDAVKAIKLVAEAPVVNVPETKVNVEAPDLAPLSKEMKAVQKAVTSLVFPELDTKEIEKLLKKQNKLLDEFLDSVPSGGGGGGGRATPYQDYAGTPAFAYLNLATKITTSGSDTYVGEAAPGTAQATASWRIQKIDASGNITWKDGNDLFDNTATDLTAGSFS